MFIAPAILFSHRYKIGSQFELLFAGGRSGSGQVNTTAKDEIVRIEYKDFYNFLDKVLT